MRLKAFAVAVAVLAGSSSVAAQSSVADGVAALARGDYQRAADVLRPIAERESDWDPAAQFFLGSMYDAGLGVPRDRLRACALYLRASFSDRPPFGTAAMRMHMAAFRRDGAEFLADCTVLGNLGFDHRFEPVTFDLGAAHSIGWTLRGATVSYQGRTTHHEQRLAGRGGAYLPLRYTPVHPSGSPGQVRHFIEVFVWHSGPRTEWSLSWHLFEVVGSELRAIVDESPVMTSPSRPGPSPAEDVRQHVTVRTSADGQVEWAILAGPKARSGLIESEDERREAREIETARRAALENVDWTRRFDVRRVPSLTYAASDGCGNVYLYAFTSDRAEAISVRVDRRELQLSTTARSFDIARHPTSITVNVTVYQQPMRHTEVCTDVGISPAPVTETWRAVAGQMTIELSPPGIRTRAPWLYRATIRIDNAEFIDSSGRRHRQAAPIVLSAVVGSGAG